MMELKDLIGKEVMILLTDEDGNDFDVWSEETTVDCVIVDAYIDDTYGIYEVLCDLDWRRIPKGYHFDHAELVGVRLESLRKI